MQNICSAFFILRGTTRGTLEFSDVQNRAKYGSRYRESLAL